MEKANIPLTVKDAETISDAILSLCLKYPDYTEGFEANHNTVKWNTLNTTTSIGLFPLQGGVYVKRYISGSYVAQFPFRIVYKCSPTNNPASINAQTMLENLAKWLEACGVEFEDEHLTLEAVERTSNVYSSSADLKEQEFTCTMQARYFYKK